MLAVIYPFPGLAVAGSVAMPGFHVAALFGITYPFEQLIKFPYIFG
jgi:hypothetical protein